MNHGYQYYFTGKDEALDQHEYFFKAIKKATKTVTKAVKNAAQDSAKFAYNNVTAIPRAAGLDVKVYSADEFNNKKFGKVSEVYSKAGEVVAGAAAAVYGGPLLTAGLQVTQSLGQQQKTTPQQPASAPKAVVKSNTQQAYPEGSVKTTKPESAKSNTTLIVSVASALVVLLIIGILIVKK